MIIFDLIEINLHFRIRLLQIKKIKKTIILLNFDFDFLSEIIINLILYRKIIFDLDALLECADHHSMNNL